VVERRTNAQPDQIDDAEHIGWVIVGGESGSNRKWSRSGQQRFATNATRRIFLFFSNNGEWNPNGEKEHKGKTSKRAEQFATLEGKVHINFPQQLAAPVKSPVALVADKKPVRNRRELLQIMEYPPLRREPKRRP